MSLRLHITIQDMPQETSHDISRHLTTSHCSLQSPDIPLLRLQQSSCARQTTTNDDDISNVLCYVHLCAVFIRAMGLISGCKDGEQSRKTISWMVSWHQMTPDTRWHQEMVSYGLLWSPLTSSYCTLHFSALWQCDERHPTVLFIGWGTVSSAMCQDTKSALHSSAHGRANRSKEKTLNLSNLSNKLKATSSLVMFRVQWIYLQQNKVISYNFMISKEYQGFVQEYPGHNQASWVVTGFNSCTLTMCVFTSSLSSQSLRYLLSSFLIDFLGFLTTYLR